jgi:hypothetical protein
MSCLGNVAADTGSPYSGAPLGIDARLRAEIFPDHRPPLAA